MNGDLRPAAAPHRTRLYALIAIALLCLGTGAACRQQEGGDKSGSSLEVSKDPIMLPGDARKIVEDLHAGSDKANATLDTALQDSIETSPARDIDDAFFKRLKAQGRTTVSGPVRRLQEVTVYVPKQMTYPARFLAYVKLSNPDNPSEPATNRLRLFEKKAADEPWKLAMYITVPPDFGPPDIAVDGDGFAQMVTKDGADDLKLEPSRVARELAEYLSGYATGPDSSIFAQGRNTNETAQAFKAATEKDAQAQITSSVEVTPGRYPVQAFRTTDGGALTLFTQNVVTNYAAAPGKALNPTAGSEGLLAPGSYASIRRNAVNMVAAVIPPTGSESLVQIAGATGGTVSFKTT